MHQTNLPCPTSLTGSMGFANNSLSWNDDGIDEGRWKCWADGIAPRLVEGARFFPGCGRAGRPTLP